MFNSDAHTNIQKAAVYNVWMVKMNKIIVSLICIALKYTEKHFGVAIYIEACNLLFIMNMAIL